MFIEESILEICFFSKWVMLLSAKTFYKNNEPVKKFYYLLDKFKIRTKNIKCKQNKNKTKINICLSCDENYAKYAAVVISSILKNSDLNDELYFYILDGNISLSSKEKILSLKHIKECSIEFVPVNIDDFKEYTNISNHKYISIATYYRLKLASLLPNLDKIIYLDCDIIVCSNLAELFNIDIQNDIFAGVLDIDLKIHNNPNYVNAGVLLMDLEKVRKQNIEQQFLEYTKENIETIQLGDQGIINDVLKGKIMNIDSKYNVQSECFIRRSSYTGKPVIIHFIGAKKPWHNDCWSYHKKLYYKYLQLTPWKLTKINLLLRRAKQEIIGFFSWFKHRPFFYLQGKFWNAVIKTYIFNNKVGL